MVAAVTNAGRWEAHHRRWLPSIMLIAVMLAVWVAAVITFALVGDRTPPPVRVTVGVEVNPPASWEFVSRQAETDLVILSNGLASLAVRLDTSSASTEAALAAYMRGMEQAAGGLATGEAEALDPGIRRSGQRLGYAGARDGIAYPIEGEVTAVLLGDHRVVVFDGWAEMGVYGFVRVEIDEIIRSATLVP